MGSGSGNGAGDALIPPRRSISRNSRTGRRPIRFSRDVPTHWNSTYKLLFESYDYRDLLVSFMKYNRDHEKHFPILAIIAKQILATSVSTVAVEQEFSTGGNILDARCSLLSPESIQVKVCVDDWIKAQNRQQELKQEALYDFFDDDHTSGTEGSE
ncbi:hypothetical protein Dsin_016550 [Dipteronia sinensis]|uniref:HAT C-terminal dimerisation domain-containing protein n=1 Tax=Dipteronia sinensis TaxID=43782 RepID=A0AAE0ADK1_9ROSI|nr:hypothetical protein Dsin_016550 [Dipteronia sinensis]